MKEKDNTLRYNYDFSKHNRFDCVDNIVKLINLHVKKGLKEGDVKDLIKEIAFFNFDYYRGDYKGKELPTIKFVDLNQQNVFEVLAKEKRTVTNKGGYTPDLNLVSISTDLIDDIVKNRKTDPNQLLGAMVTVSHELQHFQQRSVVEYYDGLDVEDQRKLDEHISVRAEKINKSIEELMNRQEDFQLKDLRKFVEPYFGNSLEGIEIAKKNKKQYFKVLQHAYYLNSFSEIEARRLGAGIILRLFNECRKNQKLSDTARQWFDEREEDLVSQIKDRERNSMYFDVLEDFENSFNVDNVKFLSLIEHMEGSANMDQAEVKIRRNPINLLSYQHAMDKFIATKDVNQKKALLKNAMYHGYKQFGKKLIESIINDPQYSDDLSGEIVGYLKAGTMNINNPEDEKCKLTFASYSLSYNGLLTQEQQFEVLGDLLNQNKIYHAAQFCNPSLCDPNNPYFDKTKKMLITRLEDALKNPFQEPFKNIGSYRTLCSYFGLQNDARLNQFLEYSLDEKYREERENDENKQARLVNYRDIYGKRELIERLKELGDIKTAKDNIVQMFAEDKEIDDLIYDDEILQELDNVEERKRKLKEEEQKRMQQRQQENEIGERSLE
ncbi:MAG: hypothetical protein E7379_03070 [Clostridiales bacterium]|nr:hypothetical protein [Clostridiales bacterium]